MKKILFGVMVLTLSAALCACGGGGKKGDSSGNSSSGETTVSGEFVFGLTQEISDVDPHDDSDAATRSVLFNMFEGLVKPTTTGEMVPAVAENFTVSDDALMYTFTLRDGVKFSDGNPVTVEDIIYSYKRGAGIDHDFPLADGEEAKISALSAIADITATDDKNIQFTLAAPDSEFIYNFTIAILEEANDANQAASPIGVGPFKISELKTGEYLAVEKNENYYADLDCIDKAKFKFIADASAAYTELQAGTIDGLQYLTNDQAVDPKIADQYDIVESTMMLVHALFLNNDYEPLKSPEVRQALNYAVNRDEINEMLFAGKSKLVQTHAYPTITAWYNADTESTYTYDVAAAKELLKKGGYPDGFDLEITVPSNFTQHVDTAQIIKEQLAQIGVNVTLNRVEWADWVSDTYRGRNYQATVIGFDISSLSPATWYVRYYSTSGNDMTNFKSEEYDKLYDQAQATVDMDEKFKLYGQMQKILADEGASVFIEDPANLIAIKKGYTGFVTYPVSAIDLASIKVAE